MAQITIAPGRCWQYSHYVGRRSTAGMGFSQPIGVAIGKEGVLFVANRSNPRITKATVDQQYIKEFGRGGNDEGQFVYLTAVALDQDQNVYTADEWLHRITIFSEDGDYSGTWGEFGEAEGQLNGPSGMAFDADENLWIVNSLNSRVQKFTRDGQYLGGFGSKGDTESQLDMPWGITIDNHGDLYIADWNNHRVQKFSPDGTHLLTFGSGEITGVAFDGSTPYMHATEGHVAVNPNSLNHPTSVAVDQDGDVYVVDWMNERVVIFDADTKPVACLRGDATGLSEWAKMSIHSNPDMAIARRRVKHPEVQEYLRMPVACAFDQESNRLLICDTMRGRLQVYEKVPDYKDPQFNL